MSGDEGSGAGEIPVVAAPPDSSLAVALLLTIAGGFLDTFTYVGHGQVFANSMTGNVVFLGMYAAKGSWEHALRHVPPIVAFLVGIFVAHVLRSRMRRPAITCLGLEIGFLIVVSFLPETFPEELLVPGIALVAAMQNSSFLKLESWQYNSVMTTGNLRRFAEGVFAGVFPGRDPEARRQARAFGLVCLGFAGGAVAGALATEAWRNRAIWIPVAVLGVALALCARRIAREKAQSASSTSIR